MADLKDFYRPLADAIRSDNTEFVRRTFQEHPDLVALGTPIGTWLHIACDNGAVRVVKYLVDELAFNVNANSEDGRNRPPIIEDEKPIVDAARVGALEIVEFLLDKGAVLITSTTANNPLCAAIKGKHLDVVKTLIAAGIDPWVEYELYGDIIGYAKCQIKCEKLNEIIDYLEELKAQHST